MFRRVPETDSTRQNNLFVRRIRTKAARSQGYHQEGFLKQQHYPDQTEFLTQFTKLSNINPTFLETSESCVENGAAS